MALDIFSWLFLIRMAFVVTVTVGVATNASLVHIVLCGGERCASSPGVGCLDYYVPDDGSCATNPLTPGYSLRIIKFDPKVCGLYLAFFIGSTNSTKPCDGLASYLMPLDTTCAVTPGGYPGSAKADCLGLLNMANQIPPMQPAYSYDEVLRICSRCQGVNYTRGYDYPTLNDHFCCARSDECSPQLANVDCGLKISQAAMICDRVPSCGNNRYCCSSGSPRLGADGYACSCGSSGVPCAVCK